MRVYLPRTWLDLRTVGKQLELRLCCPRRLAHQNLRMRWVDAALLSHWQPHPAFSVTSGAPQQSPALTAPPGRCGRPPHPTSKPVLPGELSWGRLRCYRLIRLSPAGSVLHGSLLPVHRKDATRITLRPNRFYGFCVSRLYNSARPHSSLAYRTPGEFAAQWQRPSSSAQLIPQPEPSVKPSLTARLTDEPACNGPLL